jgi:nicotinate-nucleotide adenylyltransferase
MSYLKEKYPENEFFYIIGEDSLKDFPTWKNPELITSCCDILVAIRSSSDINSFIDLCAHRSKEFNGKFFPLKMHRYDISSTSLRERLERRAKDDDFSELHEKVIKYINDRDLYLKIENFDMGIEEIKEELAKVLKPSRFNHTLGVMYTATALAMKYNVPIEKAMYAGLLHDCAKYLSDDELFDICKKENIPVTEAEEKAKYLLHAKVGSFFAKEKYGINDPDILHAIKVHTTGEPNMNLLDMIIFTADYIEPNRKMLPNLPEIRSKAFSDITEAVVFILRDTITYLEDSGKEMDDMTLKTYEFYKETTDYFDWN